MSPVLGNERPKKIAWEGDINTPGRKLRLLERMGQRANNLKKGFLGLQKVQILFIVQIHCLKIAGTLPSLRTTESKPFFGYSGVI